MIIQTTGLETACPSQLLVVRIYGNAKLAKKADMVVSLLVPTTNGKGMH